MRSRISTSCAMSGHDELLDVLVYERRWLDVPREVGHGAIPDGIEQCFRIRASHQEVLTGVRAARAVTTRRSWSAR